VKGRVLSGYVEQEEGEKGRGLGGIADAAIGQFFSGLTQGDGVLLAGVRLAEEGGGFAGFGSFDGGGGSFVGLAEEREFHGGDSIIVGALLLMETAAFGLLAGGKVCSYSLTGDNSARRLAA